MTEVKTDDTWIASELHLSHSNRLMKSYRIAVVGATGAVGQEILRTLERRKFPVSQLKPLASSRSAGKTVEFNGEEGAGGGITRLGI